MHRDHIFVGYDTVDNDFFARGAETRARAAEFRQRYDLPNRYFLSLGRFLPKKNLSVLIRAYRRFLDSAPGTKTHLVMVGSGEEETNLRMLCDELRLPVYNKMAAKIDVQEAPARRTALPGCISTAFARSKRARFFMPLPTPSYCPALSRSGVWWSMKP